MKPIITYLLITLFCVSIIRPTLPVIDYFANFDYIAEVLCLKKEVPQNSCNGKCYLMQQLEEKQKSNSESQIPQTKWETPLLSIHKTINYHLSFEIDLKSKNFKSLKFCLSGNYFPPDTPPPQQKSLMIRA